MSSIEWGRFHDPDTTNGIQQYAELGLDLDTPDVIRSMSAAAVRAVAQDCGSMLQEIYNGKYPLSTKDAEALQANIHAGNTHLFTLTNGKLIGMAALVNKDNPFGDVKFTELGRACSRPQTEGEKAVPIRPLLKYRVLWNQENQPEQDFLYSQTRAAATEVNGTPSGKGVQSVWWGGRRHGSIPMVTTAGAWSYNINGVEPVTGFVIPTRPQAWAERVGDMPLYVPTEDDKYVIDTLIAEGTDGSARPNTIVSRNTTTEAAPTIRQVHEPSNVMYAKYVVTEWGETLPKRTPDQVEDELWQGISQRLTVEADVASNPRGAAVMQQLHEQGWTLVGWEPSSIQYGAVCPEFARINPEQLPNLVQPKHHPEYFDQAGLAATRNVLDAAYREVRQIAAVRQAQDKQALVLA